MLESRRYVHRQVAQAEFTRALKEVNFGAEDKVSIPIRRKVVCEIRSPMRPLCILVARVALLLGRGERDARCRGATSRQQNKTHYCRRETIAVYE